MTQGLRQPRGGSAHRSAQRTRWTRAEWSRLAPAMLATHAANGGGFTGRALVDLALKAQGVLPASRQRDRASLRNTATSLEQSFISACVRLRLNVPDTTPLPPAAAKRPRWMPVAAEAWLRELVAATVRQQLEERALTADSASEVATAALTSIMQRAANGQPPATGASAWVPVDVVGLAAAERGVLMRRQRSALPGILLRFIEPQITPPRWASRVLVVHDPAQPFDPRNSTDPVAAGSGRQVFRVTAQAPGKIVEAIVALLRTFEPGAATVDIAR